MFPSNMKKDKQILRDINFHLAPGEIISITG